MGKEPTDYDIATSAKPDEIERLFKKTLAVGAQFGVILVLPAPGLRFEVATFRREGTYEDGRHPSWVKFTDARQDAERRDFTINGLFLDPAGEGRILDYVGGEKDIRGRLVRAIGDPNKRFEEDKLRILRAVRFACTLDFQIEPQTWAAVKSKARDITQVSHERIREELVKIFTRPHAERGLDLLDESGLLEVILPEISAMKGVEQPPQFHPEGDVFVHTRLLLKQLKDASSTLALGALFHDVGKPPTFTIQDRIRFNNHDKVGADMTRNIMRRLKFSNRETEDVAALVDNHMRFKDVQKMREAKVKRFIARPTFQDELEMHRIDCLASHGDISNWHFLRKKAAEYSQEDIKPKPLISGHDVMKLGIPEGPRVGEILSAVMDQQLERKFKNKNEALAWIKESYIEKG
ncbi:MAG: CCA tRNA nucleotidyltransferase [Candidatus Omnitrophica bacterium]|nr:CCA tRNA nucleotidyltransferase [Candidatus Omnitrophota bacterium]